MITVPKLNRNCHNLIGSMKCSKQKLVSLLLLAFLALSFLSVFPTPTAQAEITWTDITLPYTISASGNYRLTEAWQASTTTVGITIAAGVNDVLIDGQNYLVDTNGKNTYGITVASPYTQQNITLSNWYNINSHIGFLCPISNFTINNCTIIGFTSSTYAANNYDCLDCWQSHHFNIINSRLINGTASAVYGNIANASVGFCYVTGSTIQNAGNGICVNTNLTVTNTTLISNNVGGVTTAANLTASYITSQSNTAGIYIAHATDGGNYTITDSTFTGDADGIFVGQYMTNPTNNGTITRNTFNGCTDSSLWFVSANSVSIYNNLFNSTTNTKFTNSNSYYKFNTTVQQGNRIYSNGGLIGGNYWATPAHNGTSETGADNNGDGFIDSAYNPSGTFYDYYPLSSNATGFAITPNADANSNISPSTAQTVYYGANSSPFTYSAKTGCTLEDLTINGTSQALTGSYTFNSVTANYLINVTSTVDPTPTPVPTNSPNPTQRIGSSLIGNLALFAILPIAVGAMVFFIALKGFGQNGEDTSEVVLPALLSAVIITVMVEVCVYIAVYIVNAMGG